MKKTIFITALNLLLSISTFAQTPDAPSPDTPFLSSENPEKIVSKINEISLGGNLFYKVELNTPLQLTNIQSRENQESIQRHFDITSCPNESDSTVLRHVLNTAVSGLALYGVHHYSPHQNLLPVDKMQHVLVGYAIGNLSTQIASLLLPKNTKNKKWIETLIGFGSAFIIADLKELRDLQGYGTPDVLDAAATSLGGAAGAIVFNIDDICGIFKRRR